MNTSPLRRKLYSPIDAYQTGRLKVSDLHQIYWEQGGNPNGLPAIGLHGGPGGGASPEMRRFFNSDKYRIVLFDQRGCGRSTPHSELRENDTWKLVEDIEAIRKMLGIEKWVVFGGSWGSTLALAYAVTHPERVLALVLRGIFLLTEAEIKWFYQEGASNIFPDAFERYVAPIPEDERHDLVTAFSKRLLSPDNAIRYQAARAWSQWEGSTLSLAATGSPPPRFDDLDFVDAFARIENHYFTNKGFFPNDGWLLDAVEKKVGRYPGRDRARAL